MICFKKAMLKERTMKQWILAMSLIAGGFAFAGTAQCDDDIQCQQTVCPPSQKSYCNIILGTTGPHQKAMGFCKCQVEEK